MSYPGITEKQLIENAEKKLDPVIERINDFYRKQWTTYRNEVENAKISVFKEISGFL